MSTCVILSACRTPIGKLHEVLSSWTTPALGVEASLLYRQGTASTAYAENTQGLVRLIVEAQSHVRRMIRSLAPVEIDGNGLMEAHRATIQGECLSGETIPNIARSKNDWTGLIAKVISRGIGIVGPNLAP